MKSRFLNILLSLSVLILFIGCTQNYNQGKNLYIKHCANCHMEEGQGLKGLIPPLHDTDFLIKNREKIPCFIRYGQEDTLIINGVEFVGKMEPIPLLKAVEITNILNYVNTQWGKDKEFTIEEVQSYLNNCESVNGVIQK